MKIQIKTLKSTQAETLTELKENLKEIFEELTSGRIPAVRKVGELVVK